MDPVAVVAGWGNNKAALGQGLSVDALRVMAAGPRETHPVFFSESGIVVAAGTGPGEVELEYR